MKTIVFWLKVRILIKLKTIVKYFNNISKFALVVKSSRIKIKVSNFSQDYILLSHHLTVKLFDVVESLCVFGFNLDKHVHGLSCGKL